VGILLGVGGALLLLLVLAVGFRRPALAAAGAGILGGPALYFWLGGHLARGRGEGRFYSWPLGGDHLGEVEILLSAGAFVVAVGAAAYGGIRLLRPPTP